jgi:hypothetical protein
MLYDKNTIEKDRKKEKDSAEIEKSKAEKESATEA